jgi:hypothetical protein
MAGLSSDQLESCSESAASPPDQRGAACSFATASGVRRRSSDRWRGPLAPAVCCYPLRCRLSAHQGGHADRLGNDQEALLMYDTKGGDPCRLFAALLHESLQDGAAHSDVYRGSVGARCAVQARAWVPQGF